MKLDLTISISIVIFRVQVNRRTELLDNSPLKGILIILLKFHIF